MDLRLLEIFCYVYREKSFSRAARHLGLTQPTVSAHIKDLEGTVGTPLFNRLGREIEPTDAGHFLYEQARSLPTLKRQVSERMARFLDRIQGELLVGASSVPGEYLLPALITSFQADHAEVRGRLRISDTAATIEALRHGDIQLGMVGGTVDGDDLVFEPFAGDELVLVVPAAPPWDERTEISASDLQGLPLLIREGGSGTRTVLERSLADHGLSLAELRVSTEFDSTTAIKQAIKGGHGVSFISRLAVGPELAVGTLRVVRVRELAAIHRTYYTVVSRRRVLSPLSQAFLSYLDARRERQSRGDRPATRAGSGRRTR